MKTILLVLTVFSLLFSSCKNYGTYRIESEQLTEYPEPEITEDGGPVLIRSNYRLHRALLYAPYTIKLTLLGEIEYTQQWRGCCSPPREIDLSTLDGRWKYKKDTIQMKIPNYYGQEWFSRKISRNGDTITMMRDEYVHVYYLKNRGN